MLNLIMKKMLGTKNERDLRKLRPLIDEINAHEEKLQSLTDAEVQAKTDEFRRRLDGGETVDDLMSEAFAVVKNACRRLCGRSFDVCGRETEWAMVPFDVQLIGAIVLHQGRIAEMATGEGKTLVATMPVYLNALRGEGVHVVTVNDYLARRDAQWMGIIYEWLGLTVGCLQNQMRPEERRAQYECDVTYGTNSEFGFDYLRDNTAFQPEDIVQRRGHHYAIIDEIDSILIDEARTPLIISGPAPHSSGQQYQQLNPAVARLVRRQRELCTRLLKEARSLLEKGDDETAQLKLYQVRCGMPKNKQLLHIMEDARARKLVEQVEAQMLTDMRKDEARDLREELFFNIDEKGHDASLTEKGCAALNPDDPEMYVMPDLVSELAEVDSDESLDEAARLEKRQAIQQHFTERSERIHAVDQLIRAHCVYERDVNYVVQENRVQIVDEFTGRVMPGRRWSDGLHMAVEAKENVKIERETQTLASITIQNYFRMYDKLSGMTGTAETEAEEFHQIYGLDVAVIPTHRPCRRVDSNDMIYRTQREKFNALLQQIEACHNRKQPVLVGTISVETSELISRMLRRRNIPHNVLNAKNHQREAEIVANAGQPGAVTIATNMAGRGTDIKLGEGVVQIPRDVVTSDLKLEDKYDGPSLRKYLEEHPCGLCVIGSSRHESRRIDRQLRGRCARQGDPGMSFFYVSLEDDLMRLFGSDRMSRIMERLGIEEGEVLEHPWLNKSLQTAQKRVEQHNFAIRKRTLEFDDVMNKQREVIYELRRSVLFSDEPRNQIFDLVTDAVSDHVQALIDENTAAAREDFIRWVNESFPVGMQSGEIESYEDAEALTDFVMKRVRRAYEIKILQENPDALLRLERHIILSAVDEHWQEYLRSMDGLREGVNLRAYGQRDPLMEYKKEAYGMFSELMDRIKQDVGHNLFRSATSVEAIEQFLHNLPQMYVHQQSQALGSGGGDDRRTGGGSPGARPAPEPLPDEPPGGGGTSASAAPHIVTEKVGRNEPCPCGSGKKYKKCCGK
ncbi:preprotein translocase subunit SecA [Kiritimatiella glycovorans]|uniref:Protein translocase subunit SecA n=1 Tax=Kiritimatiella glycovorans TaxID=1307763 RepID=A0A0G3EHH8_9BACT|nr:preprotein translocase subunit SecA [Kiritimatiella glycovorans]AKJ63634.1 preprotein translocase subunit SecA [Kiritimatiella glycovorans]